MYCFVIFGESDDNHTRHYCYKCKKDLEEGDLVIVPVKNRRKTALVQSVFDIIPKEISVDSNKIKSVISKKNDSVNSKLARSLLLAMIDEYKDGKNTKEDLYNIIEHFVSNWEMCLDGDNELKQILKEQLPLACLDYIDEPGDEEKKEIGFWKELKDIEYKLRYGYSFWNKPKYGHFEIKEDPIEYTDEYFKIELELEKLISDEVGEEVYFGFCREYWETKKKILKNKYGIDWKSPAELNPMLNFD